MIRGIHYSSPEDGQSKLVTCMSGSILDVIGDLRHESKTFGKSITFDLNSENGSSIFISSGLGHGFQALEENVAVTYLLDKKYNPASEFGVNPLDESLGIKWKSIDVVISEKDKNSQSFLDLKSLEPS